MRYLYSFLFYLLLPFLFLRLLYRGRRIPAYRERIFERFGFYSCHFDQSIWIHAVSVGETIASVPLIKALKEKYPNIPFVVTTMTPTGAQRVKAMLGDSVTHLYIPYDFPGAVHRFLNVLNPCVAIIMETELWPNLLAACRQKSIPVCLTNARLSEKSARGYQRISSLTREMFKALTIVSAHGKADAERFIALEMPKERVVITGSLKFDLEISKEILAKGKILREQLGVTRPIWIAASTHEGEEEIILQAHQELLKKLNDALLILVPRHPERFDVVAKLIEERGLTFTRRSHKQSVQTTEVYLGDTMGEMLVLYAAADVAFVGGSLIPRGGHNILEPAALRKPLLSGHYLFNFREISDLFIQEDALTIVQNAYDLSDHLKNIFQNSDLQKKLGEKACAIMDANRGALERQLAEIEKLVGFIQK